MQITHHLTDNQLFLHFMRRKRENKTGLQKNFDRILMLESQDKDLISTVKSEIHSFSN